MRVIVVKTPTIDVPGMDTNQFCVGKAYNMSPALALLMTAAGWVRAPTRKGARRHRMQNHDIFPERRQADRRA